MYRRRRRHPPTSDPIGHMRDREHGDIETLRAAYRFVARHDELRSLLDNGTYQKLGEVLDRIDQQATGQVSEGIAAKAASLTAEEAREDLVVHHLHAIESIARVLESNDPELRALQMPNAKAAAPVLVTEAIAFATEASKWKDAFVEMGLPADFVEHAHAAAERLKEASGQPRDHRAARRGARTGAEADLAHAKKRLGALDSFVRTAIHDNPALLAEWKAVKKFPPRKKARVVAPSVEALPAPREIAALPAVTEAAPLMLPAPATPMEVTAPVVEAQPAKRPALWTLRGLFRT